MNYSYEVKRKKKARAFFKRPYFFLIFWRENWKIFKQMLWRSNYETNRRMRICSVCHKSYCDNKKCHCKNSLYWELQVHTDYFKIINKLRPWKNVPNVSRESDHVKSYWARVVFGFFPKINLIRSFISRKTKFLVFLAWKVDRKYSLRSRWIFSLVHSSQNFETNQNFQNYFTLVLKFSILISKGCGQMFLVWNLKLEAFKIY